MTKIVIELIISMIKIGQTFVWKTGSKRLLIQIDIHFQKIVL